MRTIKFLLAVLFSIAIASCGGGGGGGGGGSGSGSGGGVNDPYAGIPAQSLAVTMLTDLTTIPQPPTGTACDPQESHCAHIYVFNKSGQLIAEQYRTNEAVPAISETQLYSYDVNNKLIQKDDVWGPTYTKQATESYQYDAQGRIARKQLQYVGGGGIDTIYVYNNANQAAATATYTNSSGAVTGTWNATFTYDSAGNVVSVVSSSTLSGNSTKNYTYSNNRETDMYDVSGVGTRHVHNTYNLEGNLIRYETDFAPADNIVDQVTMYAYNTLDLNKDGVIDINIGYNVIGTINQTAIGTSDPLYQSSNYNTSGSLNWSGLSTGTCSTCGDMQGQINKILLGF